MASGVDRFGTFIRPVGESGYGRSSPLPWHDSEQGVSTPGLPGVRGP